MIYLHIIIIIIQRIKHFKIQVRRKHTEHDVLKYVRYIIYNFKYGTITNDVHNIQYGIKFEVP